MSQNRKLKATIEATLKKIDELASEYNDIWERVYSADTQAQKEKYESDLKKQVKKLQRQRELLKSWAQSTDPVIAQYSDRMASAKKVIEEKMAKCRECEKETKTKAFSKEGLRQPSKQTPEDEKREEVASEFSRLISELKKEIEDCEDEEKRERNRKKNMNQETIQQLTNYIQNHQKYIAKLEIILRKLNNHMIKPYDVLTLIDAMDNYIKSYHNPDYYVDEELFDDFDLNSTSEESDVDDVDDLSDSASVSTSEKSSISTSTPSIKSIPSIPTLSTTTPSKSTLPSTSSIKPIPPASSLSSTTPSHQESPIIQPVSKTLPINSVWKRPQSKTILSNKPINYSEILQKNKSISSPTPSKPVAASTPTVVSSYLQQEPVILNQRVNNASWTRFEICDSLIYAVINNAPSIDSVYSEKPYIPTNPVTVPEGFPKSPVNMYANKNTIGMPLDVAFFAFAYKQNEYLQYLAARTLQENGWRFEKNTHKWYSIRSQAKKNERGEECFDMSVFDYSLWKIDEVKDVVLSELDFEEELLP